MAIYDLKPPLKSVPIGAKTGVYCIRNKVNGKVYVGSAARCFSNRWHIHRSLLRRGKHHSQHLQHAWNAYGEDSFEFTKLCTCAPQWCLVMEQIHMNRLMAASREYGYNSSPTAGSNRGSKKSEEWKRMMSAKLTGVTHRSGFRLTEEHRAKIAAAHTGKRATQEVREIMRLAALKRYERSDQKALAKVRNLGRKRSAVVKAEHSKRMLERWAKKRASASTHGND